MGLRTINDRINQIEPLLRQARGEPIVDVPAVVQFDGIWLREHTQTETIKLDKRQRKRKGKKAVVLVALGLWTDGSGKQAGDPGLASRRWGEQSSVGAGCRIGCGNGACARRQGCRR